MNSYDDLGDRLLTQKFLLVAMGVSKTNVIELFFVDVDFFL